MPVARKGQDYHASHAARALEVVRELQAAGKTIRPADIRKCRDYAAQVFGHARYSPWLLAYTAVSGGFKEGWIPDNFYGERVVPVIQGPYGRISFLKSLSAALFGSPAIPNIGAQINGRLFDVAYRPLSFDEARSGFFKGNGKIVFKADSTGRGKAIRFLDRSSFIPETVEKLGNGVFQRCIIQHEFFDRFSKGVAAIRITTVVEPNGEIFPRSAYLCLPTGSDTHVQSTSQIRLPVDLADGALGEAGLKANWLECRSHPTSGEVFAGNTIPLFDSCVTAVIAHHRRIPFVGAIGWDVILDKDHQVQILEWNGYHNGVGFSEATQGPCFTGLGWERFE